MNSHFVQVLRLFVVASLLLCVPSARSQFRIGISTGLNFANADVQPEDPDVSFSTRISPMIGAIADVSLSHPLFIRGEVRYTPKGSRGKFTAFGQTGSSTWKFDYLEMPVVIGLNVVNAPIKLFLFSGPNLGLRISAKGEAEFQGRTITEDMKDVTKSTDFTLDFGCGGEFKIGFPANIFADVRYSLGLRNIGNPTDPNDTSTWKSRDIKVIIGALFDL